MTFSKNSFRSVLAGIAVISALVWARTSPAQIIRVTEPLFFLTGGEGFWGIEGPLAGDGFREDIINESYSGEEGEIRTVRVDVNNATAVGIWETAVSTCDKKEFCKSFGILGKYCVSPTRSQCINGATLKVAGFTIKTIPGIGPKPAGSIRKNFDIGAKLGWNVSLLWGVEGSVEVDGGNIDAEVSATGTIEADLSDVSPGEVFTLRTSKANVDAIFDTEFPDLNATFGTYIDAVALMRAEVAGPDTSDGSQKRFTEDIINQTTGGEQYQELAGFQVDLGEGALKLRLMGEEIWKDAEPALEYSVGIPVIVAGSLLSVELPLMDFGLYLPRLDIPVPADFEGDFLSTDYSDSLGELVRAIGPGNRGGFQFGAVNDGITDLDFGRFDLDIDVLAALAGWVLGIKATIGEIPAVGALLEVEGNILDIDTALFFGVQEELTFRPNLAVDLHFSVPVKVETSPGSGRFREVTVKRVRLGDDLNIVHPGGELKIEPHYTLAENLFINNTDLYLNPAIVGAIFQLKLGGLLYDYGFNGIPKNMAAVQFTQNLTKEPIVLKHLNFLNDDDQAEFPLKGFKDIVGSVLSLPAGTSFRRGDSNGDALVDVSDPITTLSVQFLGIGEILCKDAADSNDDGQIDISDPVHTLAALFLGTAEITAPTVCGLDPTDDTLTCEVSNCAPQI